MVKTSPLKLLVFAHTPPPHHGQSQMVELMLSFFGGDQRDLPPDPTLPIACYHVNARFSEQMEDIGVFRFEKAWLLVRYCVQAIQCRYRYGVRCLYYVPAPGKRAALYRDWLVMLLCRPFFPRIIHHWHAAGLGDWLQREGFWLERWLTQRLHGRATLGIAVANSSMRDPLWFRSRDVLVVANGVEDFCPDFESAILPRRRERLATRRALLASGTPAAPRHTFRVLYLAHCSREKGLFDTLDAVAFANAHLRALQSPIGIHLTVAGEFPTDEDAAQFHKDIQRPDLAEAVTYAGFVAGEQKSTLLRESDCLCFPTFYHAESFGLVVVEAMCAGLHIVTTRWRALPDMLPPDYPGFVPIRSATAVARALEEAFTLDTAQALRTRYVENFSLTSHRHQLQAALQTLRDP